MSGPRIIDTDTHVIESPDLWTARLPRSWGDRRLHVKWDPDLGREMWCIGDRAVKPAWSGAAYGRRTDGFEDPPATRDDAHPATWDVSERVKLMDRWGIELAVLYPNVAGFTFDPFVDIPTCCCRGCWPGSRTCGSRSWRAAWAGCPSSSITTRPACTDTRWRPKA